MFPEVPGRTLRLILVLIGLQLLVPATGNGQLARRVRDINTSVSAAGSYPEQLVASGLYLYFTADDGIRVRDLWRTDGTAAGTVLVKDFLSGRDTGSNPQEMVDVNGTLFFTVGAANVYRELWKTDGTAAGTVLVKDIAPRANTSSNPAPRVPTQTRPRPSTRIAYTVSALNPRVPCASCPNRVTRPLEGFSRQSPPPSVPTQIRPVLSSASAVARPLERVEVFRGSLT